WTIEEEFYMELDNGERGRSAVAVSLLELPDDRVRLTFDDLERRGNSFPAEWKAWSLFTFLDFDSSQLYSLEISDEELAGIGRALLARLIAHSESESAKS